MKKKITILSAFPPNNKTAGQYYTKRLIEELSKKYYIKLVYFTYPNHLLQLDSIKNIETTKIDITFFERVFNILLLFFFHPIFTNKFCSLRIFKIYKELVDSDILILNFSQVFLYGILFPKKKKILMAHDVILQKCSRKKNFFNKISMFLSFITEKFVFNLKNSFILCFSEKDKKYIEIKYNKNAIPISFFLNPYIINLDLQNIKIDNTKFTFFAAWNRDENRYGLLWFFKYVTPLLKNYNISFQILGSGIDRKLENSLTKFKNVNIIGFEENPYVYLAKSAGLIAPIFQGAGVKVKVIESLACGTPVIGTEIAFEGIDFKYSNALLVSKTPEDFASNIKKLIHLSEDEKIYIRSSFTNYYKPDGGLNIIENIINGKIITFGD